MLRRSIQPICFLVPYVREEKNRSVLSAISRTVGDVGTGVKNESADRIVAAERSFFLYVPIHTPSPRAVRRARPASGTTARIRTACRARSCVGYDGSYSDGDG